MLSEKYCFLIQLNLILGSNSFSYSSSSMLRDKKTGSIYLMPKQI